MGDEFEAFIESQKAHLAQERQELNNEQVRFSWITSVAHKLVVYN